MKTSFTLYQKGLAISVEVLVYNNKVCIRENSNSGEHLTLVSNGSEKDLLKALETKPWLQRLLSGKKQETLSTKQRILKLMAERFTSPDEDPYQKITAFFKQHKIRYSNSYWPDSDRL